MRPGASRELVQAVVKLVSAEGVSKMSTSFSWAGVLAPPTSFPGTVEIVSDAAPVLELALDTLDSNREPRTENLSGPIIALRDEGMEYAIATVSTARHGRQREVHVTIRGDDVALAMTGSNTMRPLSATVTSASHPLRGY